MPKVATTTEQADAGNDADAALQYAHALIIEALQVLDAIGAHHPAALLDHAVCALRTMRNVPDPTVADDLPGSRH